MTWFPGFIDLQFNGYNGTAFSDPDLHVEQVISIAEHLRSIGVIGFLPTLITDSIENLEHGLRTVSSAIDAHPDTNILGIHLEGPFISSEYGFRGVHQSEYIRLPDLDLFRRLQDAAGGTIRLLTLGPELPGSVPFIEAVSQDVIVAAGHTNTGFEDLRNAAKAGLSVVTHLGNACRQMIDRHDNPIVNCLALSELTICCITDGFHLPEAFVRMILNSRPVEKVIIVSDASPLAGLPPGRHSWQGQEVNLDANGRLSTADDPNVLAGSGCHMLQCMNKLAQWELLEPDDMLRVGCTNALSLLGLSREDAAGTTAVSLHGTEFKPLEI